MRLRGHADHLHYGDEMPRTPRPQRHSSPLVGDNDRAIAAAAGHFYDGNVTYAAKLKDPHDHKRGTLLLAHYSRPWKNGYRYWHGPSGDGKRVLVPLRYRHRTYDQWGQRGLFLQRKSGEHTRHLDTALSLSVKDGACPIPELKSPAFASSDRPWELLKADFKRHDVPLWPKALTKMFGFKSKVIRAEENDVPLAAIYGKGVRGRARRLARTRVLERGWKDGTRVYATW